MNRNFLGIFSRLSGKQQGKAKSKKAAGGLPVVLLHTSRVNASGARSLLLCGPDFSAFTKECVFVSEDFRWSECATGEKPFSLLFGLFVTNQSCGVATCICGNVRLRCFCVKSGNEHFYSWKITWNGRC